MDIKPTKRSLSNAVPNNRSTAEQSTTTVATTCHCAVQLQALTEKIDAQNDVIMGLLLEHKRMLQKILAKDDIPDPIATNFPITSEQQLLEVDNHIVEGNEKRYIAAISAIIRGGLTKNLKHVLNNTIAMAFNVDGTHGKKRLKDYKNFYRVLLGAIELQVDDENPETMLRKAIQQQKKRHFQKNFSDRIKMNSTITVDPLQYDIEFESA